MASQVSQTKRDKKSKKDILKKHVKLINHARSCASNERGTCRVTECHEAKRILRHINSCRGDKSCTERRCPTYQEILQHMQSCTESSCYLCHPSDNDIVTLREGDRLVKTYLRKSDGPSDTCTPQLRNSDTPQQLSQRPTMDNFQDQWLKIQEDVKHIQMTNRHILQKLNQSERDEKENRKFIREFNHNINAFCVKLTQKDQMLDRLVDTVMTLQQKLEQLFSQIQTNYIHMLHPPSKANEKGTFKVGAMDHNDDDDGDDDDDDDDDDNDDDSDEADENIARDIGGVFSNQLVRPSGLNNDEGKSLPSRNVNTGLHKESQPTDDNETYFSLSDISDVMSTGSPDEDTDRTSINNKHVSVKSANNSLMSSADEIPSGDHEIVHLDRSDVNSTVESSDSHSSLEDNEGSSQEKIIKSETKENGQNGLQSEESVKYCLPPPMPIRSHKRQDGEEETSQGLLVMQRDSTGLKRMRTAEHSDNRINSGANNMACGNTMDTVERKWQGSSGDQNMIVSHGVNVSDGPAGRPGSGNARGRGSPDRSLQKSKGITDQKLSAGIGSSYFDLVDDMTPGSSGEDYIDASTWIYLANNEIHKGKYQVRGKGPDTVLCLDISESMMGENFKTMMLAAKSFIKEIENVAYTKGIQENIAITIFGHETRVLRHLTNDYQKLLSDLDGLTAGGNTPMTGGLLMALSGCIGNGRGTSIKSTTVHARIILLTDGKATANAKLTSDREASSKDHFRIKADLCGICEDLRKRRHRVYWVPIGHDSCSTFTDYITSITKGKTIAATQPSEMRRLIQWTQIRCVAVDIAEQYPKKGALETSVLQHLAASHGHMCNIVLTISR